MYNVHVYVHSMWVCVYEDCTCMCVHVWWRRNEESGVRGDRREKEVKWIRKGREEGKKTRYS